MKEKIDEICSEYYELSFAIDALSKIIQMMTIPTNEQYFSIIDLDCLMNSIVCHADVVQNDLMKLLREADEGGDIS